MKKAMLVVMMFTLFVSVLSAQTAVPPASGNGTSGNPYEIATLNNLYWITQNTGEWDKHFIQTEDIDAYSTTGWDSGNGFSPIGNSSIKFAGSYDGQDHTIDGLFIDRGSTDYVGLFGYIRFSTPIDRIGVTNVDITGDWYVGGLVGYNSTNFSNCYASGSVTGNQFVGGLVGENYCFSTVSNSYATGSVTGTNSSVGGLVGHNHYSSTVSNCYATCSVSGTANDVGGLVGWNHNNSTISNSYATGSVSGYQDVGGLVGDNSTSTVENSFWDTETSSCSESDGGTGKTTEEMKYVRTFTDVAWSDGLDAPWDFVGNPYDDEGTDDDWNIDYTRINDGYPFLSWQDGGVTPDAPTNVIITIVGDNVQLDWDDMGVSSYNIYRSEDPNAEDWGTPIGSAGTDFFVDEGGAAGTKYFYYVTAVD